ncbi:peptide-binding protein [Leisingera daeponensis]|uniref:Peptide-binding protein n=1 Tax=Leisingera daeponensis TaxID=405746 RepID=A0ABS7NN40_9RHOB|nr:peptide-binding protein [Leisingera daeponensis]MBY6141576.1 peptide-binding protein [Leisingera daeponensis]
MKQCLAAALLWLSSAAIPAAAQEFPALYSVTGVAADDMLNIRSAPQADAEIIGTLAPDQTGVEVIRPDTSGKWGLVNSREQSGWTAPRFLDRTPVGDWYQQRNQALDCFGTEPFWSLTLDETPNLTTPDDPDIRFTLAAREAASGRSGKAGFHAVNLRHSKYPDSEPASLSGTLTAQHCSDGMSDRTFGITIDMLQLRAGGKMDVLTGCCSLIP